MHFNNEKDFTYKSKSGTDILWTAVHEAGHSLGLEHSPLREAVMYPYITENHAGVFELRQDDTLGIQALYGEYWLHNISNLCIGFHNIIKFH